MAAASTQEYLSLLSKIEALTTSPPEELLQNDDLRRRFRESAKSLSVAMEMPGDTIHRIGNTALQASMARIGNESNIFKTLAATPEPLSSAALAKKTDVDPILMTRLLRYYQSFHMVKEVSEDAFTANNVTNALAGPGGQGIIYLTTVVQPTYLALPEYLKTHKYQNPTNPVDSPWQAGYQTDLHPFVWLQTHPKHFELFMMWLALNREGLPLWYDVFPFDKECGQNTTDDTVLFVDIGSALGHQSIALRQKFPDLQGKIVIQDTEQVISAVKLDPALGIEAKVHDFFTPQPVKGARAYYMRNIIHDHQDAQAKVILENTIASMSEDSVILIDDMMLPEKGTPWRATILDITMMTCLAAKERSEKEMYALLESVGLGVVKVWKYTEECDDCIIVAKPKKFLK